MVNNEHFSFLSNFSARDISEIISDISLIQEGYKIFYVVDTYDIMAYSLPFLCDDDYDSKSKASQIAIAYNAVFERNTVNNLILLDEYKIELLSIKNSINERVKEFPKFSSKLIQILKNEISFEQRDIDNIVKFIKNNFDIIIANQIFLESGDNIFSRFNKFVKTKLNVFDIILEDSKLSEIMDSVFESTKPSSMSNILYDAFVERIKFRLLGFETPSQRYLYLENAYRDILVIDRIIQINDIFERKYKNLKVKFRYLSSAPFRTKLIFDLISNMNIGKNIRLNRNIYQCYLIEKAKQLGRENTNYKKILQSLCEILVLKSSIKTDNKINVTNTDLCAKLNNLLVNTETDLKNSMIFETYQTYQKSLNATLNDLSSKSKLNDSYEFLSQVNKMIKLQNNFISSFDVLQNLNIEKTKQVYLLNNRFNGRGFIREINIPFGKDIIRNTFQHLPVLLFIEDRNVDFKNSLYKIFDLLLNPINSTVNKDDFNKLTSDIIDQLTIKTSKNLKEETISYLVVCFLNIITKFESKEVIKKSKILINENDIIHVLTGFKKTLLASYISPVLNEKLENISIRNNDIAFMKELDYLMLWLLRRNRNCVEQDERVDHCEKCYLDDVIIFGIDLKDKYPDDGRFNHGLALAFHAKAYGILLNNCNLMTKPDILILLKQSRSELKNCLNKYYSLLGILIDKLDIKLVSKNIIAVHNTIADGLLREFELFDNQNINLIESVKEHIKELKQIFLRIEEDSKNYPTIVHTEAELIYREANYLYSIKEYKKSYAILLPVNELVKKFESQKALIPPNFNSIVNDINELRHKLISKIEYN